MAGKPLDKESKLYKIRHSAAHVMAQAVLELFPEAKYTIGPPIENGFYYDFDLPRPLTPEDLKAIEKGMRKILAGKHDFVKKVVSAEEAREIFKDQPYKLELIDGLESGGFDEYGNPLEEKPENSLYIHNGFVDLCRGPHVSNTSEINPKAVKLMSVAGAYWRGDEKNPMLQRIYGTAWETKEDLDAYLWRLEEAKKRDHRVLGKQMELFAFSEKVGQGLPLWLPKGAQLRELLEQYLKKVQREAGYEPVITPHIGDVNLYKTSGHYQKYGAESFRPITTPQEGEEFFLKPMNCPHHCEIYKVTPHSYRDLPVRYAEFGTVYRYEQSGELHGLTRVRGFTQDDAHIFCTPDQIKEEFNGVIDIIMRIFKALSFDDFITQISLRDPNNPEKYIGSDENWEKAERAIIEVAEERGLDAKIEYGEAAFYGPKMDFMVRDAIGRKWQLGTIQVDYNLPERFDLTYIGADNEKHRPVMIHRAPFGSMERFVAVLIEHCAGNFPLWLTPEQAIILPISEKYQDYAEKVLTLLKNSEIRALIDGRSEKTGRKIRDAEMKKIPYMLIVGEKEEGEGTVSVRKHGGEDLGTYSIEAFADMINKECEQLMNIQ